MTDEQLKALHSAQLEEVEARLAILKRLGYEPSLVSNTYPVVSERTAIEFNGQLCIYGTMFTVAEYASIEEGARNDIADVIAAFESEWHAIVYAVTAETSEFGIWLDLFHVSQYPEEWERDRADLEAKCPCVYVVSEDEYSSEFGGINFEIAQGGILRTA